MELDYKAKQGQTVFDVSNITLYGMDNIVLGLLQPSGVSLITSLSNDLLAYNDSYTQDSTVQLDIIPEKKITDYVVKGKDGQSSFDLCIMNYGNLDKLLSMIQTNSNIVSINDIDISMKDINFSESILTEAYVVNSINKKGYSFATIQRTQDLNSYLLQENGFYLLQEDGFKIIL